MEDIKQAIKILKDGGIVIFPTDTAFGIGCRIDNKKAIKRLFKIRKRPPSKATPILIDSLKMAQEYAKGIPQEVIDELIKPYWPGALTVVLPCKIDKVAELVRGGGNTIGVRIPNHSLALEIIKGVGVPVLGPSANFHGERTPYSFSDLNPQLISLVDYVVRGETNNPGKPSTIIDCSVNPWRIIRQGAVELKL